MTAHYLRGVMTPAMVGVMTPNQMNEAQKAAVRAVFDKHLGTEENLAAQEAGKFRPHWSIEIGDSFAAPGGTARVTRRARTGTWVDVIVVAENDAVWSKRMPLGIPQAWERVARR